MILHYGTKEIGPVLQFWTNKTLESKLRGQKLRQVVLLSEGRMQVMGTIKGRVVYI